tara:strand:- start:93 stop:704 length:612 start_codon:yes stop_codon:yes gene_type:complete
MINHLFIKTDGDRQIFPYTQLELIKDNPSAIFTDIVSDEQLTQYQIERVTAKDVSAYEGDLAGRSIAFNDFPTLIDGEWILEYTVQEITLAMKWDADLLKETAQIDADYDPNGTTLVQVRECDGACCKEDTKYPKENGDAGCRYVVDNACIFRNDSIDTPMPSEVGKTHFSPKEFIANTCWTWPHAKNQRENTGNCCWQWVDN